MGLEPSASHVQTSKVPVREEEKTLFVPSGEYCGPSSERVDEINFACVPPAVPFLPRAWLRQMIVSERVEM